MHAIAYCRYSPRPDPSECESCELQEAACREYAARQGWELAQVFNDPNVSGADDDREVLWDALAALKKGSILVVYRLSRLTRSVAFGATVDALIEKAGARIVSVGGEGTWGDDSPENELMRNMIRALNQYQRRAGAAYTKAVMRARQARGEIMGSKLPYGYRFDRVDPTRLTRRKKAKRLMVPDAAEQGVIVRIREMSKLGCSLREIAKALTAAKIPCRGAVWNHGTISDILARSA